MLERSRLLPCAAALAACGLPFLLESPLARTVCALLTWLALAKALQYAAGHERPRGAIDFLMFIAIPAVVRWDGPRRTDLPKAWANLAAGLVHLALLAALWNAMRILDLRNAVELFATGIGIYLGLAGVTHLAVIPLCLRGLEFDPPFARPYAATSPAQFWARWNTWVSYMLHRYVFLPAGGRRRAIQATLAAFAVSGLVHEVAADIGTARFSGWLMVFFVLQGVLVAATSRSRAFKRMVHRAPAAGWAVTMAAMLASGTLLVRGIDGLDPSRAWERCCTRDTPIDVKLAP